MNAIEKRRNDEPELLWHTQDGQLMRPSEMRTLHLFYSVRMIFNHLVPEPYQIQGCKRYSGIREQPKHMLKAGANMLLKELATRDDLPLWAQEQLEHMRQATREIMQKQMEGA